VLKFAHPLLLLLLVPMVLLLYIRWRRSDAVVKVSSLQHAVSRRHGWLRMDRFFLLLHFVSLFLLVVAIARPRSGITRTEVTSYGIDIVIVLDVSGSMEAIDFKPQNRLYVAKEVAEDFIKGRGTDRIGLVLFARFAYTQCPLTTDHGVVIELLRRAHIGMIEDGTAIGLGLAQACDRLKDSKAESRVVILLTDGRNNTGEIEPETAIRVAKALDVKVYTIGAGKPGEALMPVDHPLFGTRYVKVPDELDEGLLQRIAEETGGRYFRAKDPEGLVTIFKTIDKMEKSEIKVHEYTDYREFFRPLLVCGLGLLIVGIALSNTRFLKFP
jgi:Ca-activated chloride channel family protein